MTLSQDEVHRRAREFENESAETIVAWALERFRHRIALSTSFQLGGIVLIDIALKIDPNARVFTLDTGRLHQETYNMMDRVRERYGITLEVLFPDAAEVEAMVRTKGPNLFYDSVENRQMCCAVRKVSPLQKYLAGLDAWVSALRRDQSPARANVQKIELDAVNGGIIKFNPLADWTWQQIDDYAREHRVPRHPLYAKGYASIGCLPCTRAIEPGQDVRAGRWWWESGAQKECGMHVAHT